MPDLSPSPVDLNACAAAPAPDRMPAALDRLRTATRPLHDAVEATGAADRILSPDVGRDDYRDFLRRTLAVLAPVERWLSHAGDLCGVHDPMSGSRTASLTADLRALGSGGPPAEVTAVADAALAGLPLTRGSVLGCLYVLEGSALGGTVIARHIAGRFGAEAEGFTRFHSGQGLRAGDRFRIIRDMLADLSGPDLDAAEDTALALFGCFLAAYGAEFSA